MIFDSKDDVSALRIVLQRGSVTPGVHEVLRRQGLLAGTWCFAPDDQLSPGQADQLSRVCRVYPHLTDDSFVAERCDGWLR